MEAELLELLLLEISNNPPAVLALLGLTNCGIVALFDR